MLVRFLFGNRETNKKHFFGSVWYFNWGWTGVRLARQQGWEEGNKGKGKSGKFWLKIREI